MQSAQLSLFDTRPLIDPDYHDGMSIEERFQAFHEANPHVYHALRKMALDLRRRGFRRYGIKALFEVLRFNHAIQTNGDAYKLNNNYTALYARLLMEREPHLRGFFETRKRVSAAMEAA